MNNQLSNFNSNLLLLSRNTTSCSVTETYLWDPNLCGTEPDTKQVATDLLAWLQKPNRDPNTVNVPADFKLTDAGNGTYLINSGTWYMSYLIQETDDGLIITSILC